MSESSIGWFSVGQSEIGPVTDQRTAKRPTAYDTAGGGSGGGGAGGGPDRVAAILARYGQLKADRGSTETYWQGVADYMLPSREFTRHAQAGSTRTAPLIFNTMPLTALEQLAGALHGMLTSPSLRWFALRPADVSLETDETARAWFQDTTERMYGVFTASESQFDVSLHELYLDLAGLGTGALYVADGKRAGPRFEARPLSEIYVSQNATGQIDTLFRAYREPLREIVRLWPATTGDIHEQAAKRPDDTMEIVHATIPSGRPDVWDSCYVLVNKKIELEADRYNGFPFAIPRWLKRSGETYGFGPGMGMLPDVKLLNKLEELNLRGLSKVVDPALLLPDDGFLNAPSTAPGSFNYFRSGAPGMDKIGPMVTGARPDLANDYIKMIEGRIEKGFYVNWLSLPQQPNMTATEILQRRDEMLRLLGPMVSRITAELLGPVIKRTFSIMAANEMLLPPPPVLRNAGYRVDYIGPLATAQRASDAESVMRWFGAIGQIAQIDPSVTDVVNPEETARFLGSRLGVPASVMRTQQEIDAKRQAAAQQAQQQHEMMAAQAAAGTAKNATGAIGNLASALQTAGAPPAGAANQPQPANVAAA